MDNVDVRWVQRFSNYSKALQQLDGAVALSKERELSNLEKQGLVQAFEYTHELAWKTLKDFLEFKGNKEIYGSKDATRKAFQYGMLDDGDVWMAMIKHRNETSHTYNEATVEEIVSAIIGSYIHEFNRLKQKLSGLVDEG